MAVLGLCFCARAFSSCGKWGPLFIAVRGPLTIAASLLVEHRLQTRRLGNCGSRAQLLRGIWDLPRPGLEPVSPALAGRFSTTAPPGKPPKAGSFLSDTRPTEMPAACACAGEEGGQPFSASTCCTELLVPGGQGLFLWFSAIHLSNTALCEDGNFCSAVCPHRATDTPHVPHAVEDEFLFLCHLN